jgi:hypothetical protein
MLGWAATLMISAAAVSGCGISMQDEPEPLPSGAIPKTVVSLPPLSQ